MMDRKTDDILDLVDLTMDVTITDKNISFQASDRGIRCIPESYYLKNMDSVEKMRAVKKLHFEFFLNHFLEPDMNIFDYDISGKTAGLTSTELKFNITELYEDAIDSEVIGIYLKTDHEQYCTVNFDVTTNTILIYFAGKQNLYINYQTIKLIGPSLSEKENTYQYVGRIN